MSEAVTIRAEISAVDQNACRFVVSQTVFEGSTLFETKEDATGSPLAERLFDVSGVKSFSLNRSVLTVLKESSADWPLMLPKVGSAIREVLLSGVPPICLTLPNPIDRVESHVLVEKVQALLDRELNPSIAGHNGRVEVERVEGNTLHVRMMGGCQGCAASKTTVDRGVSSVVRKVFPQIKRVIDVTDHASGESPYYSQ